MCHVMFNAATIVMKILCSVLPADFQWCSWGQILKAKTKPWTPKAKPWTFEAKPWTLKTNPWTLKTKAWTFKAKAEGPETKAIN